LLVILVALSMKRFPSNALFKKNADDEWPVHSCCLMLRRQFSECRTQVDIYFKAIEAWKMATNMLLVAAEERRLEELNKRRELLGNPGAQAMS